MSVATPPSHDPSASACAGEQIRAYRRRYTRGGHGEEVGSLLVSCPEQEA